MVTLLALVSSAARGAFVPVVVKQTPRPSQWKQTPPPSQWVPVTARVVEWEGVEGDLGALSAVQIDGVYARDRSGMTYSRLGDSSSKHATLGVPDIANLIDRVHGDQWKIYYFEKVALRSSLDVEEHPDLAEQPMSREVFERTHAHDRRLGRKVISRIECEGYRLRNSGSQEKYNDEMWYAPGLNYLVVKSLTFGATRKVTTVTLVDIQSGKDPDPKLFQIPAGFKVLH